MIDLKQPGEEGKKPGGKRLTPYNQAKKRQKLATLLHYNFSELAQRVNAGFRERKDLSLLNGYYGVLPGPKRKDQKVNTYAWRKNMGNIVWLIKTTWRTIQPSDLARWYGKKDRKYLTETVNSKGILGSV